MLGHIYIALLLIDLYMNGTTAETKIALVPGPISPLPPYALPSPSSGAVTLPNPFAASLDSLVRAAEKDTVSPGEHFQRTVDLRAIPPIEWSEGTILYNLGTLIHRPPAFRFLDPLDITTHAVLAVTSQPGPVFVATAHAPSGSFRVELLPNPLMPAHALKTWKVGPLKVTLLNESDEEVKPQTKKRGRANKLPTKTAKRKPMATTLQSEYPFDKLEVTISDLAFPASGCRPMRLEFSCHVMDPLGRQATFTAASNSFMIISNCNQWKDGLCVCLRNFVFPNGSSQAPFNRFFNYLQLTYLDSKGFPEARFLDPSEVKHWLLDSCVNEHQFERDRQLLEQHQTVTIDLFETWFEIAGPVFYDLHTSNVGKLFQKLWAAGFVGIGSVRTITDDNTFKPGHCRLTINTRPSDDTGNESYLMLQQGDKNYVLLTLERDHLAYFFEHSRNSQGCTHLLSSIIPGVTLPIEDVYAEKASRTSFSSSGAVAPSYKSKK